MGSTGDSHDIPPVEAEAHYWCQWAEATTTMKPAEQAVPQEG